MIDIQRLYSLFKECSKVTTDSRAIAGGEMFFGLKGENFDGNEYALKALEQGAKYAVVNADSAAALASSTSFRSPASVMSFPPAEPIFVP